MTVDKHLEMANAVRVLSMDAVENAQSGHPGLPMGAADIATVLFTSFLKFDPTAPNWPDRDRFILSAGHGSMLLYAILHLLGYEDMTIEELKRFRQLGSKTPGHPEIGESGGIETTTGPLGQGLAIAVGMALAERLMNARFGDDLIDHYTYVLASDGDLMEGISHEAISLAGHLCLNKLIVLFDDNGISIDGPLELSESGNQRKRFEAANWNTQSIDGHDPNAIATALKNAKLSDKPTLIACKTKIGFGAPTKEGSAASHGSPLGAKEIAGARETYGWNFAPFDIPSHIRDAWRIAGLHSSQAHKEWNKRAAKLSREKQAEFERVMRGDLPSKFSEAIISFKSKIAEEKPTIATRQASQMVLEIVNTSIPETIGGSADLTGSNNTRTHDLLSINANDFSGRYIHYGIREHGMAAAMNGMALHGGIIPYGGTFLVFSDYCRPALRLSALMHQRVIYVFTHDSIGLGEDGPTHQPIEHLASLRAIPGLVVFRPADAIETAEAWQLALEDKSRPSAIILTRQSVPTVCATTFADNNSARGAYELAGTYNDAQVSIYASGSEISIALAAKDILEHTGHPTRVISVPSFERFNDQSNDYKNEIIGTAPVKVAIEAALRMGWDQFIGHDGHFIGMNGFGASGPQEELYKHFGITPEMVVAVAIKHLSNDNEE